MNEKSDCKQISIIPKPVFVKYNEGIFSSEGIPSIVKKECPLSRNDLQKDIDLPQSNELLREAYRLVIEKNKISLEAQDPAGFHHGEETFRQLTLSEFKEGKLTLPCCEITDYPRFSWRGFMLDCSRYFYSASFIKKQIDIMSLHHMNRFHWHLTDDQGWRFHVKDFPLLTETGSLRGDYRKRLQEPSGGFYSEDEIKDIVEYAAKRHIEVIPEVDLPGHACAILASYPELGCTGGPYHVEERFGIFEDVLCAGNDKIFDLAEKIFETLAKLFPSKWMHIGGDEVPRSRWDACPKCQKRIKELGIEKTSDLQSWITFKLVNMLSKYGKTAIGWDEILEDCQKFKLPGSAVVMSWRGDEGGIKASSLGYNVIMAPNTKGWYLDHKHIDTQEEPGQLYAGEASVFKAYSTDPAPAHMNEKDASFILGGQGNLWSELIYAGKIAEYMIYPRLCAIAESLWTRKENKNFDDFEKRLGTHRLRLDTLGVNQHRGPNK